MGTFDDYEVYVTAYAKVRSGKVLDESDFTFRPSGLTSLALDLSARLAIYMAVDDIKGGSGLTPLRSRESFEKEHQRRLGLASKPEGKP